jgi:mono/diheme cytochrome c family protein
VLLGLATSNKILLAVFAGVFIAFALAAALVIPRRNPDFPGERGRNWFIVTTIALFVAMMFAVAVFASEDEETARGEEPGEVVTETAPGGETQPPATTTEAPQGDAQAGRAVFLAQGCGSCHVFSAAGTQGSVGPNLDESLEDRDAAYIRESVVDPNAEIAEGFQPGIMPGDYGEKLTPKQVADLVAFLSGS